MKWFLDISESPGTGFISSIDVPTKVMWGNASLVRAGINVVLLLNNGKINR